MDEMVEVGVDIPELCKRLLETTRRQPRDQRQEEETGNRGYVREDVVGNRDPGNDHTAQQRKQEAGLGKQDQACDRYGDREEKERASFHNLAGSVHEREQNKQQ